MAYDYQTELTIAAEICLGKMVSAGAPWGRSVVADNEAGVLVFLSIAYGGGNGESFRHYVVAVGGVPRALGETTSQPANVQRGRCHSPDCTTAFGAQRTWPNLLLFAPVASDPISDLGIPRLPGLCRPGWTIISGYAAEGAIMDLGDLAAEPWPRKV